MPLLNQSILTDVVEPTPTTQLVAINNTTEPGVNIITLTITENGSPVASINVGAEDLAALGRVVPLLLC